MEQNSAEELRPCSAMEFDRIRSSSCLLADTSVAKLVVALAVADTSVAKLVVALAVADTSTSAAAAADNLYEKVQLAQHWDKAMPGWPPAMAKVLMGAWIFQCSRDQQAPCLNFSNAWTAAADRMIFAAEVYSIDPAIALWQKQRLLGLQRGGKNA